MKSNPADQTDIMKKDHLYLVVLALKKNHHRFWIIRLIPSDNNWQKCKFALVYFNPMYCTCYLVYYLYYVCLCSLPLQSTFCYWNMRSPQTQQLCKLQPVLAVLAHSPLVSSSHLTLVAGLAGRTHFNGGVLKRCSCHSHLVTTLHRSRTLN